MHLQPAYIPLERLPFRRVLVLGSVVVLLSLSACRPTPFQEAGLLIKQDDMLLIHGEDSTQYYVATAPLLMSGLHEDSVAVYFWATRATSPAAPEGYVPIAVTQIVPQIVHDRVHVAYSQDHERYVLESESGARDLVPVVTYVPLKLNPLFEVDGLGLEIEARVQPEKTDGSNQVVVALNEVALALQEVLGVGTLRRGKHQDAADWDDPYIDTSTWEYFTIETADSQFYQTKLPSSLGRERVVVRFSMQRIGHDPPNQYRTTLMTEATSADEVAGIGLIRHLTPDALQRLASFDTEDARLATSTPTTGVNKHVTVLVGQHGEWYSTTIDSTFNHDGLLVRYWGLEEEGTAAVGSPLRVLHMIFEARDRRYHTGIVQYLDLEGGFYGIVDDEGHRYQPLNLHATFQEDSLAIRFLKHERTDYFSSVMWGTPIDLLDVTPPDTR